MSEIINKALSQYQLDVIAMSDIELYKHVYDGNYDKNDFASRELKSRGIKRCKCSAGKQDFSCPAKMCCIWKRNEQF